MSLTLMGILVRCLFERELMTHRRTAADVSTHLQENKHGDGG